MKSISYKKSIYYNKKEVVCLTQKLEIIYHRCTLHFCEIYKFFDKCGNLPRAKICFNKKKKKKKLETNYHFR